MKVKELIDLLKMCDEGSEIWLSVDREVIGPFVEPMTSLHNDPHGRIVLSDTDWWK